MRKNHFQRLQSDQSGAASVEFAIIALTVIIFMPLIYDLSQVVAGYMALSGSMRAGIQYALKNPTDTTGITSVIRNASNLTVNTVSVSNTQTCQCSGVAATCGSTCSGGVTQAQYQTITASYNIPTMIPYAGYPSNYFPISKSVMVRVQ